MAYVLIFRSVTPTKFKVTFLLECHFFSFCRFSFSIITGCIAPAMTIVIAGEILQMYLVHFSRNFLGTKSQVFKISRMWTSLFIGIYVLIALSIVLSILLHGAKPSKSLAWLLAIFALPVGGIVLYLLLGRNRRKNKLMQLKKGLFSEFPKPNINQIDWFDGRYKKLMTLTYKNSHFPPTSGNKFAAY